MTTVSEQEDDSKLMEKAITEGKHEGRVFTKFNDLSDDLMKHILSFLSEAPLENLTKLYASVTLTHTFPLVSKKFLTFADLDLYWKPALLRQLKAERRLWGEALKSLGKVSPNDDDENYEVNESNKHLVERISKKLGNPGYKSIYRQIIQDYLRFQGPVFYMEGIVQLGEPYGLHFFEPRYRLLIAEVMKDYPESSRNGGPILPKSQNLPRPLFIHANRGPLCPTSAAVIVEVIHCVIDEDGTADVQLLPVAYCWLEKVWIRPESDNLYYGQGMRMGADATKEMNQLVGQETLASMMRMMAGHVRDLLPDLDSIEIEDDDDSHLDGL